MAKRSAKVNVPLTWGTIGGGIEGEENNKEEEVSIDIAKKCAWMEIVEETCYEGKLDLNFIGLLKYNNGIKWEKGFENFTTYLFVGFVEDEFKPEKNWETEEFRWVDYKDIESLGELHPCTKRGLEETAFNKIVENL